MSVMSLIGMPSYSTTVKFGLPPLKVMVVSPPRAPDWATNRKGTCRSTSATFSAWLSSMTCRVTTTTDADVADTGVACPVTVMTVGSAPGTDWAHGSAGPSIAIARILHVSSPWKKSWQAECLPHLGHKLLIQGGAGAFAWRFRLRTNWYRTSATGCWGRSQLHPASSTQTALFDIKRKPARTSLRCEFENSHEVVGHVLHEAVSRQLKAVQISGISNHDVVSIDGRAEDVVAGRRRPSG